MSGARDPGAVTGRRVALRQIVGGLFGALGAACGAAQKDLGPRGVPPPVLMLDPLVDLVTAAGLDWLVAIRPLDVFEQPPLAALLAALAPAERLDAFARRHGADLRQADQVAVASHGGATLGLARLPVDPARVETAFAGRATVVEGRAVEHSVTRFWGNVGNEREQVAVFGYEAVGIERGRLGALQAAVYFAQKRLKRARPALGAEPLAGAAARLGNGPLLAFVPGPFEGPWADGLGGLLRASTAFAARLRACQPRSPAEAPTLELRLVLTGAWGSSAGAAAERLTAAFQTLVEDPLGRLTGLDRPVSGPTSTSASDAISLDVGLDPVRMMAGARAASAAPVAEIMTF